MSKKRYYPKRPKGLPKGYDSWAEYELYQGILKDAEYHPEKIKYNVSHTYEPDFLIRTNKVIYLLEFKGYFRDSHEAAKYTWIKKVLPNNYELLFIFDNPQKPIHFRTKRTDGTRMTHGEWALKNNFKFFDKVTFTDFYLKLQDNQ